MNLTIEQLENIYNYIANRSNKDTSFPISSYEDLNMFTGLNKENKNVLFKKEIIDDKFNNIINDYTNKITDIKDNYIKKGDSDQTFILDNGERQSAIIDIDDEIEYNNDNANISLISSDSEYHPTIHLNCATSSEAGLMSAVDKNKIDKTIQDNNDVKVEGNNFITTVNNNGGILIYDKTKGINTIDINGNLSKITFNVRQGNSYNTQDITLIPNWCLTTSSFKIDKELYVENIKMNSKLYFGINSINYLTNLNALNPSFYSGIGTNNNFGVVYDNKSVIVKNDKITFINNNTTHNTEGTISYDGNLLINNNLVCDGFVECDGINCTSDVNIYTDDIKELTISGDSFIFMDKSLNKAMRIIADVKSKTFKFDNLIEVNNDINNNDSLTLYDNTINFYDSTNDESHIIAYDKDNLCLMTDSSFKFDNEVNIGNTISLNNNGDATISGNLDAGQVNTNKVLLSSTTDKVTDSTTIFNTDIVISQSGSNSNFDSTLNKNGLTVNSKDSFNGTSKSIYSAGTLSVSKKEDGVTYTQYTNLDENSISFVKIKDSGSKTTKALWIDSNDEFNFTGANVNFNKEINVKSDANFYGENIYFLGKSNNGKYNGCHLWFRDNTTQNDTSIFMLNDKFTISHETSSPQVYPFTLDAANSIVTLKDARKKSSNYDNSVYTPNSITINSKINTDDIQGISKFEITNIGCALTVNPTGVEDITENITSFDINGFGVYKAKDDNNYTVCNCLIDEINLKKVSNNDTEYNLLFAFDGTTIDYKNTSTKILKNDSSLEHKNYNRITIENTNTSVNKDIDIKNYDVLINDNSRFAFKYNGDCYVFNVQKAIELGLLTKV